MDIKKIAPWNWFKKEEEAGATVPVRHGERKSWDPAGEACHPIQQLHREMDRMFDNTLSGFGLSPFRTGFLTPLTAAGLLRPQVDIGANNQEYCITVEVPGVDEKDVTVEIAKNTLTIRGEKKQEKEEKDKDYYRVERSYGSFQRVLSLPEDADQDAVQATFKNGVLRVAMPRKALPKTQARQIAIK